MSEEEAGAAPLSLEEQLSSLRCEMIFNLCTVSLVFFFLEKTCGIPIQMWMIVYNLIAFAENAADYLSRRFYSDFTTQISLFHLFLAGFKFFWLVWGNLLFFSQKNDCREHLFYLEFFFGLFILHGYVLMAVILISFGMLCYRVLIIFKQKRETKTQSQLILKLLKRMKFKARDLKVICTQGEPKECIVCFELYKPEDHVIQLLCDKSHHFHSRCIQNWVKNGKTTCPLCRLDINESFKNNSQDFFKTSHQESALETERPIKTIIKDNIAKEVLEESEDLDLGSMDEV